MKIRPICMDMVDWATWNLLRKEEGQELVTHTLDRQHIKPDSPAALVNVFSKTLHDSMRESITPQLRVPSFGFLLIIDEDGEFADLQLHTDIPLVLVKNYTDGRREYILKGNLYQLQQLVIAAARENVRYSSRAVANAIYHALAANGLKDLWADYKRTVLDGNTFVMTHL